MEEINNNIVSPPVIKSPSSFKIPLLIVFVISMMALSSLATYLILKLPAPIKTSAPVVQSSSAAIVQPTPNPSSDPTANWKTYTTMAGRIQFDYPTDGWGMKIIHPIYSVPKEAESFEFFKPVEGGGEFSVTLGFGISGVGGGCPDFNPAEEVVQVKPIRVLGQNLYEIFKGSKSEKNIQYEYLLGKPDGFCPNVAFVEIPGLEGLIASEMIFKDSGLRNWIRESNTFLQSKEVAIAERILESIRFNIPTSKP